MAVGTIIAMPASGAENWSDFPLIVTAQQAGFAAFSITNPASTVASIVGTGSVLDVGGSLFTFPSGVSIDLETATPSADIAVYYVVKPVAGTTCTVTMEGTAPTWVASKQGFYLSAASLTRYVGGCYIGTAGTYYSKWLYKTGSHGIFERGFALSAGSLDFTAELGQNILYSADREAWTDDLGPVLIKTIRLPFSGDITITFDLKKEAAGSTAYGKVYLNGTMISDGTTVSNTYVQIATAASVVAGDWIDLYGSYSSATPHISYVRNFRVRVGQQVGGTLLPLMTGVTLNKAGDCA